MIAKDYFSSLHFCLNIQFVKDSNILAKSIKSILWICLSFLWHSNNTEKIFNKKVNIYQTIKDDLIKKIQSCIYHSKSMYLLLKLNLYKFISITRKSQGVLFFILPSFSYYLYLHKQKSTMKKAFNQALFISKKIDEKRKCFNNWLIFHILY